MQLDLLQKDLLPVAPAVAAPKKTPRAKKSDSIRLPESLLDAVNVFPEEISSAPREEDDKAPGAFKTISEAATFLGVPQHVLRFWESRFAQIKPLKMRGGRRYYRPEDMEILSTVKNLLYKQGYTIKGARKAFAGRKHAVAVAESPAPPKLESPEKLPLTEKQQSQLSVLRHELIGLREVLKPYIFGHTVPSP